MDEDTAKVGNSGGSGDSQSSESQDQQSPDLATILRRLENMEKRYSGLQKGTDKVNARVEQRVEEILSSSQIGRVAELAKAGKDSAEIENQLLLEEILAERKGKTSGSTRGKESSGGGVEVNPLLGQIASEFGLDANDSAVAEALSKGDLKALVRVAKSKASVPAPDATTQPPLTPKAPTPDKALEIEKGYLAEIKTVKPGNTHHVSMVKAKWRKIAREAGLQLNV
jgi:hypothetical protein